MNIIIYPKITFNIWSSNFRYRYASSEFKDLCKSCPSSSIYLPQELLALSTALSATLTAQLAFDPSQLKYCSTYRLAEAVDQENKQHGIYHLGSEYELAVTPKKITSFSNFLDSFTRCFTKFRQYLENFVDHNFFQRTILFCILTNTFCMGIEFHSQPELLTKVVEISNLAFSCVFAVEMIMKRK